MLHISGLRRRSELHTKTDELRGSWKHWWDSQPIWDSISKTFLLALWNLLTPAMIFNPRSFPKRNNLHLMRILLTLQYFLNLIAFSGIWWEIKFPKWDSRLRKWLRGSIAHLFLLYENRSTPLRRLLNLILATSHQTHLSVKTLQRSLSIVILITSRSNIYSIFSL